MDGWRFRRVKPAGHLCGANARSIYLLIPRILDSDGQNHLRLCRCSCIWGKAGVSRQAMSDIPREQARVRIMQCLHRAGLCQLCRTGPLFNHHHQLDAEQRIMSNLELIDRRDAHRISRQLRNRSHGEGRVSPKPSASYIYKGTFTVPMLTLRQVIAQRRCARTRKSADG